MTSLQVRRATRRMHSMLVYGFGVFVLVALALALFWPGHPWPSALVGLVGGGIMFAASWITTSRAAGSAELSVGPIALDYLIKIALTLGSLVLAKSISALQVGPVAALLISAIVLTAGIQVTAFAPAQRGSGTPSETDV